MRDEEISGNSNEESGGAQDDAVNAPSEPTENDVVLEEPAGQRRRDG